jgi:hypothetical protein
VTDRPDDFREVDLTDDLPVLPDHPVEDADERLRDERPPHWE